MNGPVTTVATIIPIFNSINYIGDTLRSVITQSPAPHEIVIVDDGSTDGSAEAAREVCPSAVVLTGHPRGGPAVARARGVAATSSEWLAFCDADDLWPAGRMAALLEATADADWITGRLKVFVEPGHQPTAESLRADGTQVPYLVTASLIRRSVWDELGGIDTNLWMGEDVDLYLRYRETGRTVRFIDDVTMHYRLRGDSFSASNPDDISAATFATLRAASQRRRQASAAPDTSVATGSA